MIVEGPDGANHYSIPSYPVQAVVSFQVVQPPRVVRCEEYGCTRYLNGFKVTVPEGPQADLARSLRHKRASDKDPFYHFAETRDEDGQCVFTFPPGQQCFATHRKPWDGRERMFRRLGDWRVGLADAVRRGQAYEFTRGDDWVDAFANNQITVADRVERG